MRIFSICFVDRSRVYQVHFLLLILYGIIHSIIAYAIEMNPLSNFNQSSYWFESAEYDLQTARAMMETQRLLYVGFMCHQAMEKAVKGVFVLRKPEKDLSYIHKLMCLANLSGISGEMGEEQFSLLDLLSPLNIEVRYPLHKSKLLASLTVDR